MERNLAIELIDFLYDSPSACHGVKATQRILNENGFIEIKEEDKWDLKSKGKYYVIKNDSALIAFEIGSEDIEQGEITNIEFTEDDTVKLELDEFTEEEVDLQNFIENHIKEGNNYHTWNISREFDNLLEK